MRAPRLGLLAAGAGWLVTAVLCLSSCCLPTRLRYGFVNSPEPVWTTNLRTLGYYVNERSPTSVITAMDQIAFGNNEELAVLNESGALPGEPNHIQVFVLDAKSGKIINQKSWIAKGRPALFGTARGHYVADTDKGLVVYAAGLEKIIARYNDDVEKVSPDGRVITVWQAVPGHAVTKFLDADTLEPTGAEFINLAVDSIAVDRVATEGFAGPKAQFASVYIHDSHRKVAPIKLECNEVRPRFISQHVLAVFCRGRMHVVTDEGETLFTTEASDTNRWVAPASRDGSRFAVIDTYESAADWSTVCFERVKVYDAKTGNVDLRAEVRDVRGTLGGSGVALSSDGRYLAVNSLGVVRIFAIP